MTSQTTRQKARMERQRNALLAQMNHDDHIRSQSIGDYELDFFDDPRQDQLKTFFEAERKRQGIVKLKVCDMGAGKLVAASEIAKYRGVEIVAVDPKPPKNRTIFEVRRGSMEFPNLPASSQHVILAHNVHNYTHDKLKALQQTHVTLAPGGIALISIAPQLPIIFHYKKNSLLVELGDLVNYLKTQGHAAAINNSTLFCGKISPRWA